MLLIFVISICTFEFSLQLLVNALSNQFPWILTTESEKPRIENDALDKFAKNSFDYQLGWVRHSNVSGLEQRGKKVTEFSIDEFGSRRICIPSMDKKVVTFGDSYAFCRHVNDNQTWQHYLGIKLQTGIQNFGVGNYGLDQAIIRYESMEYTDETEIVILCFVPETIARIQSVWKHYFEHGNTLAFKPRFRIENEALVLVPNFLQNAYMYNSLNKKAFRRLIQTEDKFYDTKFRKYQFRFPYLYSLIRHPFRQTKLILSVTSQYKQHEHADPKIRFSKAWDQIIGENIKISQKLYRESSSTELLSALLTRFNDLAKQNGHIPLVVVIPQFADLQADENLREGYRNYFDDVSRRIHLIDLTKEFTTNPDANLYVDENGGGHLSSKGNQIVADAIYEKINRIIQAERQKQ